MWSACIHSTKHLSCSQEAALKPQGLQPYISNYSYYMHRSKDSRWNIPYCPQYVSWIPSNSGLWTLEFSSWSCPSSYYSAQLCGEKLWEQLYPDRPNNNLTKKPCNFCTQMTNLINSVKFEWKCMWFSKPWPDLKGKTCTLKLLIHVL